MVSPRELLPLKWEEKTGENQTKHGRCTVERNGDQADACFCFALKKSLTGRRPMTYRSKPTTHHPAPRRTAFVAQWPANSLAL
jgi:hypothetical protein